MSTTAAGRRLEEPAARDWGFPREVAGIALLVAHGSGRGLPAGAALEGTGLGLADLAQHHREVTADQELRVVRNLRRHLADQGELGIEVGATYHVSTFGIFGYALLASRTVLDAMNMALRFLDLSFAFAVPRAELVGDRVRITVDGTGLPRDVRRFLVQRDATAIRTVLGELVPGGVPVDLRLLGDTALLEFDAAQLERPLPQANPQTAALCEALCRDVVARRRERTGIAQDVRVLIAQLLPTGAAMVDVAARLGLSERTLRRRLAEADTGYQPLLDEVRESLARELLGSRAVLSVEDVAQRLGYAEASSFITAFRRWTGTTPAALGRPAPDDSRSSSARHSAHAFPSSGGPNFRDGTPARDRGRR